MVVLSKLKCDVLLVGYEEWENLGLRYLAAFLEEHDVNAKIQPYNPSMNESVLEQIKQSQPKVVGFSMIFQRMLEEFSELIGYLRANGVTAHFTMGGHFPTVAYKTVMKVIEGLDSVIRCEGEAALLELFKNVHRPESLRDIKGLVYRDHGDIKVNDARPLIQDLDSLPLPIRSDTVYRKRGLGVGSIISSRGCFYHCSFCSIRQFYDKAPGPKRRCRSPENVVTEMKYLLDKYDVRIFIFEDDDFLVNSPNHKRWIESFVSQLKTENLDDKILWRISCRIDDIDSGMIRLMKGAGLASVYLGIESGNERGLKTFNKRYKVADIYRNVEVLESLEMPFEFGFMILHPDCTFDTIREDIEFLKGIGSSGHALVHFTKMLPYAGTAIESRLREEGRLIGEVDAPDYPYLDARLDLLQMFFTQAFHERNFGREGLVERLRDAKLDTIIARKFSSDTNKSGEYQDTIYSLIRECNLSCLERMGMAVNLMRSRSEAQILENWWLLEKMAYEESLFEAQQNQILDSVMYSFRSG